MKTKVLVAIYEHRHGMDIRVYPAGDYWRTTLARPVLRLEGANVRASEYHGTLKK